jgi:hypothetical protein
MRHHGEGSRRTEEIMEEHLCRFAGKTPLMGLGTDRDVLVLFPASRRDSVPDRRLEFPS